MKKAAAPEKNPSEQKAPRVKKAPATTARSRKTSKEVASEPTTAAEVVALQSQLQTAPGTIDHEMAALFEPPKPLGHATEVFDEYELASMREMEMTAEAVQRARRAAIIKPPKEWDGETCFDCGLDIEPGRLALGYYTCIVCERQKEVRSRQYRS